MKTAARSLIELWLEERNLPAFQLLELGLVDVHTNNADARIGETGSGYQAHVSSSNYGDPHDPGN
jgi:hypothetical protein